MKPSTFLAASYLKEKGHSVQVSRGVEVPMRKIVLSVGTNHSSLGLRNKVLAQAGYLIVPAKSGVAALNRFFLRQNRAQSVIRKPTLFE